MPSEILQTELKDREYNCLELPDNKTTVEIIAFDDSLNVKENI